MDALPSGLSRGTDSACRKWRDRSWRLGVDGEPEPRFIPAFRRGASLSRGHWATYPRSTACFSAS